MKIYDVIICGAGPAGNIAAINLVKKGLSVLLIDKHEFPRDKICGDCLAPSSMKILNELNLLSEEFVSTLTNINMGRVYSPRETSLALKAEYLSTDEVSYVIPRIDLDNILLDKSKSFGANFHNGKLYSIEKNQTIITVKTKNKEVIHEFQGKYLIGADGVSSSVARLSNLKPCKNRSIAIRAYVEGVKSNPASIEIFYNENIIPGYGWFFPVSGSKANIGIGMKVKDYINKGEPLKDLLTNFMESDKIKSKFEKNYAIGKMETWALNLGNPRWNQIAKDQIILVGDAASLINPASGGGISSALMSGQVAAETILEAVDNSEDFKTTRKKYIKKIKKLFQSEFTKSKIVANMFTYFPGSITSLLNFGYKYDWPFKLFNNIYKDVEITKIKE